MGAAYTLGGFLAAVIACRASAQEPQWGMLVLPMLIAFWVGWYLEGWHDGR